MPKRRHCRYTVGCLAPALLALLAPLSSVAAPVAASIACASVTLNDEQAEAVCTVPATAVAKSVRFKAHFLGSHDDSIVSLQSTTLDGTPVACGPGSKTDSRFEDGEVTLDCAFATVAGPSSQRLKVMISLHHLQLDRTELVPD